MKIQTIRFGEIEIGEDKLLTFVDGLPPFEDCKRFVLITDQDFDPFMWLQSVEDPALAFAVINPFLLFSDYVPTITDEFIASIGDPQDEDIMVLTMCVIPKEVSAMTTNLVAPLYINTKTNQGRQIIMESSPYVTRQAIFAEVRALVMGGDDDAGTD